MGLINRGAVVIKPKQAYLDWLRASATEESEITLAELRHDCSVYLLPDWDTEDVLQQFVEQCCADIFEQELALKCSDESTFPKDRSWPVFREWFDVEPHSMVINLMDGELVDDEDAVGPGGEPAWKEALARRMQSEEGRAAVLQDAEAVVRDLITKHKR